MTSLRGAVIRFLLGKFNVWNKPLADIRKTMEKIKAQGMPLGVESEIDELNGIPVYRLFPPEAPKKKAILYFHGGGFCLGIYHANREFTARIARETGITVVLPDYRLAPEDPFPAALEDAVAVYRGLLHEGYRADDIVVMGDSSGCGLALAALLVLRQDGTKMPRALVFITPVFDFAGNGKSLKTRAAKDPFKLADPLGIAKIYVGANNPSSPVISPLYGDLAGLPPILVHAADYDVFLSDSLRLHDRASDAGVKVDLKVWPKMWHIFHMQDKIVPEGKKALEEMCSYVKNSIIDVA